MLIAVNGTLMKGLAANHFLVDAGAKFVHNARTAACYRLWSIRDEHPAMLRDEKAGASISLEIWEIPPEKMIGVLEVEPPGLVMGRVLLEDGKSVMGILAEPFILAGGKEITEYGGWREYRSAWDLAQSERNEISKF